MAASCGLPGCSVSSRGVRFLVCIFPPDTLPDSSSRRSRYRGGRIVKRSTGILLLFLSLLLSFVPACTVSYEPTEMVPMDGEEIRAADDFRVTVPARAHLVGGSVLVFENGFAVRDRALRGAGTLYSLDRTAGEEIHFVPVDSVMAVEYYEPRRDALASTTATLNLTALGILGGAAAFKAVFGSCPTIYSLGSGRPILEAEAFSYSIAYAFRTSDEDRLGAVDADRPVQRLLVANQALETHYIDAVALISVDHPAGFEAYLDPEGRPVLVGAPPEGFRARSRWGGEVTDLIASRDDAVYRSGTEGVRRLEEGEDTDWLEFEVEKPREARQLYVALRMRNTLMNTVFLYEMLLADQGYRALEWMGNDLARAGEAFALYSWYSDTFGLDVTVEQEGRFVPQRSLGDSGPIAWEEVGFVLEVPEGPTVRFRLEFLPDNWMIDQVAVSSESPPPGRLRRHAPTSIQAAGRDQQGPAALLAAASRVDDAYVVNQPGEAFTVQFDLEPSARGTGRTLFLDAHGYYTEWLRAGWLHPGGVPRYGSRPGYDDSTLIELARRWEERRHSLEALFFETMLPLPGGGR